MSETNLPKNNNDVTTLPPVIIYANPPENNEGTSPSVIYSAVVGGKEVLNAFVAESLTVGMSETDKAVFVSNYLDVAGNLSKVTGVGGLALSVYEDGTVGMTTTGVSTLAGVGVAALFAGAVWPVTVGLGAAAAIWGEDVLDLVVGEDDFFKQIVGAVEDDIAQQILNAYETAFPQDSVLTDAFKQELNVLKQDATNEFGNLLSDKDNQAQVLNELTPDVLNRLNPDADANNTQWLNDVEDFMNMDFDSVGDGSTGNDVLEGNENHFTDKKNLNFGIKNNREVALLAA